MKNDEKLKEIAKQNGIESVRGITLVALVVTAIILIILAGITLDVLVCEGGLIERAKQAKTSTEQSVTDEQDKLNRLYSELKIATNESGQVTVNISDLKQVIVDTTYPVGSIYISIDSKSPADLFGGTWEKIEDKFLLANGSTYGANTTGGSATTSYTPEGTVEPHQLTLDEMPSHTHVQNGVNAWGNTQSFFGNYYGNYWAIWYYPNGTPHSELISRNNDYANESGQYRKVMLGADGTTGAKGGGQSHNHAFTGTQANINTMPPYMTVYMWKRTA